MAAGSGVACAKVCEQSGEVAVYSGTYKNGNPFFICRANAPGRLLLTGPRKKRGTMARPKRPRVAYRVAWLPLARSGTRR